MISNKELALRNARSFARGGNAYMAQAYINRASQFASVSNREVSYINHLLLDSYAHRKHQNPLYRILTEDINRGQIENIINGGYPGFTTIEATGFWEKNKENSLIIEVTTPKNEDEKVKRLAEDIRKTNRQQAVLVQKIADREWYLEEQLA